MKLTKTKLQEPKIKRRQRNSNYNNHPLSGVRKPESTKYSLTGKHPNNQEVLAIAEVELTPDQSAKVIAISKRSEVIESYIKLEEVSSNILVDTETMSSDWDDYHGLLQAKSDKFVNFSQARQSGKSMLNFRILKNRSTDSTFEVFNSEYDQWTAKSYEVYPINLKTSKECIIACLSCLNKSQYTKALKSKTLSSLVSYVELFVLGKSLYE